MSDDQTDCVVVGGGPSGLVLALLLARAGWQVTVVERGDGSGPPPVNVGPFVSPPNLRLFADLGFADELAALGQPMGEVVEHFTDGNRFVLDYAAHVDGGPAHALSVPLWSLSRLLREELARQDAATVLLNSSVQSLVNGPGGVEVALTDRTLNARFVVCSDGKFSEMRALIDITADVFEFDRPMVMMLLPGRPDGWPERIAVHHTDSGALVAALPVAENQLAVQWLDDAAEFDAVRAQDVSGLCERVTTVIPELTEPLASVTDWNQVLIVRHHIVRPEAWSRDRVVLLGDAAHGVHSLGGQGLNMGIQDAVALSSLLVESGPAASTAPLIAYERLRRPYVEEFQRYQMSVRQLTSTAGAGTRPIYKGVAEAMVHGQPQVAFRQRSVLEAAGGLSG
ncbi:FAD-dependent oxidoreductase [Streptomyces sp. YGL11-2]|uniref:FAD-dependent oxidoreductase n=1 Tax=Streptomyces sp. YGL11-2 TaxID=3414028 RepID=UPI003CF78DE9